MATHILGVSAFYHDSAACLVSDGEIVAAAQEERFTRKKFDAGFPSNAIRFCLERGGISLADLKYFVFYDKPLIKFERLLETYVAFSPKGIKSFLAAMPVWLKEKILMKRILQDELVSLNGIKKGRISLRFFSANITSPMPPRLFIPHHLSLRRFSAWTALANGPRHQHGWEKTISSRLSGKFTFRIRSDCFTRRLPTIPGSELIQASTKSWAWRLMVSPNT